MMALRRRAALQAGLVLGALPLALRSLPAVAAAATMRPLSADDFRASRQRGVGLGVLRHGDRSQPDHDAVAALGAGHVRMFIEAERDTADEAYRWPPAQLAALDAMLANLERRGIYMVLAAGFGEDARAGLWRSSRLQASAVLLWRQLALRLRGRAVVAGFDIVNEPVPPGLTYAMRQERWLDFAARVVEAVQAADPQRVVIVESAPDATPESFENLRALPIDNLVYSVHSYRPMAFTHQVVMTEFAAPRRYPETDAEGRSTALVLAESLDHVHRFTRRHDVPIYVGEFSAIRFAPDGSAARYVADSIALFNRHGWSWAYHEFRAWHGWDPEMASPRPEQTQRSELAPVVQVLRAGLRAPRV